MDTYKEIMKKEIELAVKDGYKYGAASTIESLLNGFRVFKDKGINELPINDVIGFIKHMLEIDPDIKEYHEKHVKK
jgi:hypothetical protein